MQVLSARQTMQATTVRVYPKRSEASIALDVAQDFSHMLDTFSFILTEHNCFFFLVPGCDW